MEIVLAILYLLIGIYILICLILKNKKNNIIGSYSGISVGIILYYCIIPIIILISGQAFSEQYKDIQTFIIEKDLWKKVYPLLLILIGFVIYNCVYNYSSKMEEDKKVKYNSERIIKISKIVGISTLFIGGISLIIYIMAYGGLKQAFEYAEIVRAFNRNASDYIPGYIAILIIPARLITVAPFAFFIIVKESLNKEKKKIYIGGFIISFIMSIIYFIINAGRGPLLYFLLSFVLVIMYKFIKKPWRIIFLLGIIGLPLLDILDSASLYFQTGSWNNININYIKYIYQFSHPFKNIINMVDINSLYGLRWGQDFITSIIGLIPGINFPASYENTSMFYGGVDWRAIGGTPNDLITFAYIQFGILGIPLLFGIIGYVSGKIDKVLKILPKGNIQNILMTTIAIQIFSIIPNADFVSFVRGGFILILVSIIVLSAYSKEEEK